MDLLKIRGSILVALGIEMGACGPNVIGPEDGGGSEGTDGQSDGHGTSVGGTSATRGDDASTGGDAGSDADADADADADDGMSSDGDDTGSSAACPNGTPILQGGVDDDVPTGFEVCPNGTIHRVDEVTCESPMPPGRACTLADQPCTVDEDCIDGPFGRCLEQENFFGGDVPWCGCAYGCATDADCDAGQLCACGSNALPNAYPTATVCISTACVTDDSCDLLCALGAADDGCGVWFKAACTTDADACASNTDCEGWGACLPQVTGEWACESLGACGRPLLVDGAPRIADVAARDDWRHAGTVPSMPGERTSSSTPDDAAVSRAVRARLAVYWQHVAQLEHASVASFARFCLELCALGAPPDLLHDAQAAMGDEIDHARRCFALASHYAGEPLGPAPLDLTGVTITADAEAILTAVIEEACIGETLAAVEAEAALAVATDPAVRLTLQTIAADELRHARLGWRTVQWALAQSDPQMRTRLIAHAEAAIGEAERTLPTATVDPDRRILHAHGHLDPAARRDTLRSALAQVIRPCLQTLTRTLA